MRKEVNKRLQEELCKRKAAAMKLKEGAASFLDMDSILNPGMFKEDGVHLNEEGNLQLGKKVLAWLKERERHLQLGARV